MRTQRKGSIASSTIQRYFDIVVLTNAERKKPIQNLQAHSSLFLLFLTLLFLILVAN